MLYWKTLSVYLHTKLRRWHLRNHQFLALSLAISGSLCVNSVAFAATLHLRAGIIKGDGSIRPVARTVFTLTPSAGINAKEDYLAIAAKLGLKEPDPDDYFNKTLLYDGVVQQLKPNTEKFEEATYKFYNDIVRAKLPDDRRTRLSGRTNLAGEFKLSDIATGDWEIYGTYRDNFTSLSWARRFTIHEGDNDVELANDNCEYNFWPIQVPKMSEGRVELTEIGKRYAASARQVVKSAKAELDRYSSKQLTTTAWAAGIPLLLTVVGMAIPMDSKSINNDSRYQYQIATPTASALFLSGLTLSGLGLLSYYVWDKFQPPSKLRINDQEIGSLFSKGAQDNSVRNVEELAQMGSLPLVETIKNSYSKLDEAITEAMSH